MYILLNLFNNDFNIIKNSEIKKVLDSYSNLTQYQNIEEIPNVAYSNAYNPKFILNNPVTLHRKNLVKDTPINILKDYAVTPKADGIRYLMYILESNGKTYLIDNSMNVRDTGIKNMNWAGSLIEGEYIKEDKLFLTYDILFERGNDIRKLPFYLPEKPNDKSRLSYLESFNKNLPTDQQKIVIKMKNYKFGNIFEKTQELWDDHQNFEYNVDGLIYIPYRESYPIKAGTWDKLLKWKPERLNSFDFLVKVEKDEKGQEIRSPFTIYGKDGTTKVTQYKTLVLYVGKHGPNRKYGPSEFNPLNQNSETAKKINHAKIELDENQKMLAKDLNTNQVTEILDDTIVEFIYDKEGKMFKWKPLRVRHDKTDRYHSGEMIFGNHDKTANDIWRNVNYPVTIAMLTTGVVPEDLVTEEKPYYACQEYDSNKRLPFQNFHNLFVKRDLIKEVAPKTGGRLLDLACGKSGDLPKWTNAGYKKVISFDVNKPCIDYARNYYESYQNNKKKPEVVYIWGDTSQLVFPDQDTALSGEGKNLIKNEIPSKYSFDVVSCQFCIHYYFENEIKLRALLQNVSDNLKIGGYFIGTSFDGKRVVEALKGKKLLEGKSEDGRVIWKIEKLYTDKMAMFNSPKSQFGRNIKVYVSSIDSSHEESLVNYKYFTQICKEYGLEKVKVEEFGALYNQLEKQKSNQAKASQMSDVEKEFSFLNNIFIYQKKKHAPDSLYKKLKSMMGKKSIKIKVEKK